MAEYSITGTRTIVRFGPFEFDLRSSELPRDGHCDHLQPQPLAILQMLLTDETIAQLVRIATKIAQSVAGALLQGPPDDADHHP